MNELIRKLQAAKDGSGNLNDEIFAAMKGCKKVGGAHTSGGLLSEDFWLTGAPDGVIGGQVLVGRSPMYTFNIAAARTLIESGMAFSVEGNAGDHQSGRYGRARIWCAPDYAKIPSMARIDVEASGATPALALCIAALKARQAALES